MPSTCAFNPSTQIRFGLPAAAQGVTLTVHDLLGRRVATLLDGANLGAGWHEVTFQAGNLSSGIYTYRLSVVSGMPASSGALTLSRSLILIK